LIRVEKLCGYMSSTAGRREDPARGLELRGVRLERARIGGEILRGRELRRMTKMDITTRLAWVLASPTSEICPT